MKSIAFGLIAAFATTPLHAQTWEGNTFDTGALIHGGAIAPGGSFSLSCTAPSPQGRPLIETGDHESLRTDTPYDLAVSFSIDLIDPFVDDSPLPAPQMFIDGQAYPLPPMEYSDFYGAWTGITTLDTPGILELFQVNELIVDPGRGTAFSYPVIGLSAALDTALAPCLERWFDLGHPLPPRVQAYVTTGLVPGQPAPTPVPLEQTPSRALPAGFSPAPQFEIPDVAPQLAFDHIFAQCNGPFEIAPEAIQSADLDGDGVADFIVNYAGVDCGNGIRGGGFCGAANCSIEVFVSTRNHDDPFLLLGLGVFPVLDAQGRAGMLLEGTASTCAGGLCETPFIWTGSGFAQN